MAANTKNSDEPKRLNRLVGAGEALQRTLDPVFRKRGFATRDLISRWSAMAPAPYNRIAAPDRLAWPRGERSAGGAILYLRCVPGHQLALSHEGGAIAAAINRYFGYVLVSAVRLSAEPLVVTQVPEAPTLSSRVPAAVESAVEPVGDTGLRDALRRLGRGIMGRGDRA
jgi:hypothetical protein